MAAGSAMSPEEIDAWRARGADLPEKQLDTVRGYAKTWASTIGAFVGITTIIAAIAARDTLIKLPLWLQCCIGALLGLSLVAAAVALDRGVRAQVGPLAPMPYTPEGIRDWFENEPGRAVDAIKQSRAATIVSLLALAAAIYLTWIGAARLPPATQWFLGMQPTGGAVACGRLATEPASGAIVLRPRGPYATVPVADGTKLTKVDRCP
jgi:hypothetical protein